MSGSDGQLTKVVGVLVGSLWLLGGCGGGDGSESDTANRPQPIVVEEQPNSLGEDEDGNLLWDDIDSFILEEYEDSADLQAAAKSYAVAVQAALLRQESIPDPAAAEADMQNLAASIECLERVAGNRSRLSTEILIELISTKQRLMLYANFDEALSGRVISFPSFADHDCGSGS